MAGKYGVKASTLFSLGNLRSNATAKNNQHKNNTKSENSAFNVLVLVGNFA